jgi:hypothetical protein
MHDGLTTADIELYEAAYDLPQRVDVQFKTELPDLLRKALSTSMNCERYIEPEQQRIRVLLKEAEDRKNPIQTEIDARHYQLGYVEKYLTRAAAIARRRYHHLQTLTSKEAIETELEKIRTDLKYWFEMYAWGYDPRARTPLSVVPFELFPTQARFVDWLEDTVFTRRTSGLIEKSRDEGATETMVRWGVYHWLYTDGFSMLMSSRKEDEVDSKKNQNTLFERIRFQLKLLPSWQLPKRFNLAKDMSADMLISNPQNDNTLLGEAPVENMGRGGRVTVAMLDEFAFWKFGGYPQYRSLSQTTDSIIVPSSVAGRLNQYADLAFDGVTRKFIMDWRDHPLKDQRWYDSLPFGYIAPKMSRTTIAQEIDRNYDAAQPGKVWTVREELSFITLTEFLRPFKQAKLAGRFLDSQKRFRLPRDWRYLRHSDYGQSEGHDWSYLLAAQPSGFYPLNDVQYVFFGRNLEPTGLRTNQAVQQWRGFEEDIGVRSRETGKFVHEPFASYCSHEQKKLREVLMYRYGEMWHPWKTDYHAGIEQIQDWWTPVDVEQPNPYRPELNGRCRLVFVAPDDSYNLAYNDRLSTWFVTMSTDESAFMTLRKQISAYHYPETELGKAVKAMRPVKEFDDIIDALRSHAVMWNMDAPVMSPDEAFRKHLQLAGADELLDENIRKITDPEIQSLTVAAQQHARHNFDQQQRSGSFVQDEIAEFLRETEETEYEEFHEL